MPLLINLSPGTRFRQPSLGITGVLLKINPCRALVRLDRPERPVEFRDRNGAARQFVARRCEVTSWAPTGPPFWRCPVEVLCKVSVSEDLERINTMAAKKTTTTKTTLKKSTPAEKASGQQASVKQPAAKKSAAKGGTKKMSALDAAVKVLSETKEPLATKAMIERMEAKGYWKSPGGKTPHATLYSAILREINTKGKDARFKKTDRGQFAANK